jgi:NADH-quinone oxidoreductase subunit E
MTNSNDILTQLRKNLKIDIGETRADGLFTLETTECLGQCDSAPGMSIDEVYYGNLTAKKTRHILKDYQNQT